jgi:antirestriction protein ArdC
MPDKDHFLNRAGRYLGHMQEHVHWTDHPNRLNRELSTDMRTPDLLAELAAALAKKPWKRFTIFQIEYIDRVKGMFPAI